ncbi:MAG: hypothetical protein IKM29_02390 [Clostridia bacterium]|nr:hypothetical protein [Clostridia bacterium]
MRIAYFAQTPFITHDGQNQLRIVVADWDYCNPFRVTMESDGEVIYNGTVFQDNFTVLIPVPQKETNCTVIITPFEDIPVRASFAVRPPKKWRIGLVYSSHEDIGYCAWANKLEYESYLFLLRAMELCEKHSDFRYMIEHVWWLQAFERYATQEERERLQKLFDSRKIELNGIYCGYHTHWAEGEQLVYGASFAAVEASKKWNIRPTAAILTDISGISWQSVSAYAGQGIKYAGILENGGFRKPDHGGNPPPISRWRGQNGRDSLLLWYQTGYRGALGPIWCNTNRQYPEGTFFFDESKALRTEEVLGGILGQLESAPYDIFPLSFYDDREKPTTMLLDVCRYMNKKWEYPKFSMELPSVILEEIEKQSGDKLPEIFGDITDQWADFATIAPEWIGKKRRAMRRLLPAEMLNTFGAVLGREYDPSLFREVQRYGNLFDEHCWATSSKHPQKMHRFNLAYVKKHSAEQALALVDEKIKTELGTPNENLGLVNLLPVARKHPLRLDLKSIPQGVAVQRVGNGGITEPIGFGPMEVKRFLRREEPVLESRRAENDFETDYYRVKTDGVSQKIVSIVDMASGKELLDSNSQFALGTYIYAVTEAKQDGNVFFEVAKSRGFSVEEGEVAFVVTAKSFEEQSGADVEARFIFYKHAKSIDVDLCFWGATGLMGDYYDRYKKNIFFAFPFAVENHRFFTQLSGGRAHATDEKFKICPMDFSVAEEWFAVEGEDGGIGIRSEDMPVFHFSQINYNRFLSSPEFPCSHMYLYAASNRTNNLNFCTEEDCRGEYRLSIMPYSGKCEDALFPWSRCLAQPILVSDGRELPSFEISAELRLLSCRAAGTDSVLFRFAECRGKNAERVRLSLPFAPKRAVLASPDGKEICELEIDGNSLFFDVKGGDYATVLVYGDFEIKAAKKVLEPVYNVFTVHTENSRSIVCFEKADGLKVKAFRIIGDGEVIAEVENLPEAVQTAELDCRPKQIEVEIVL